MGTYDKKINATHAYVFEKENMGVVDNHGTFIIPPKYNNILYVEKYQQYIVEKNKKFGLLSTKGETIVSCQYEHMIAMTRAKDDMGEGYEIKTKDGIGWMDTKGKVLIAPECETYGVFNDTYYIGYKGDEVEANLFDKNGQKVFQDTYFRIEQGGNGSIYVQKNVRFETTTKLLWGILDGQCKPMTENSYEKLHPFKDGFVIAKIYLYDKDVPQTWDAARWGIINEKGQPITAFIYDYVGQMIDGRAAVKKGNKSGYIDEQGNFITDIVYDSSRPFKNGYAPITRGGKNGLLDRDGNEHLFGEAHIIGPVNEKGLALYMPNRSTSIDTGYTDFTNFYTFSYNKAQHRFLFQDETGKPAPVEKLGEVQPLIENSESVMVDGLYGMVDGSGAFIIEPMYEDISTSFWGDLGFVKQNGKYAFINRQGTYLTDFIFEKAGFLMAGFGIGVTKYDEEKACYLQYLVNNKGNMSEKPYKFFGTQAPMTRYDNIHPDRVYGYGGQWYWDMRAGVYTFDDLLTDEVITTNQELSYFRAPNVSVATPFILTNTDDCLGEACQILDRKELQDPLLQQPIAQKENTYMPPAVIASCKVSRAKNKFNPNFFLANDPQYLYTYQQKTQQLAMNMQERFMCGVMAAVSEWALNRIATVCAAHFDFSYAFKKLEAIKAATLSPNVVINYLYADRTVCKQAIAAFDELPEKEQDCIRALDVLQLIWSEYFTSYGQYKYEGSTRVVPVIALTRSILSATPKKAFNEWLEDVFQRGQKYYTQGTATFAYPCKGIYNYHMDELIPDTFFWNPSYKPSKIENEKQIKIFFKELDWEANPYLDKAAFDEWYPMLLLENE